MTATRLELPAHLRARWSDLPRMAALAQRRLGPPLVHPVTRPAAWWLWLFALAVLQAGGRLLSYGSCMLSVTGPRMSWRRRATYGAVFLLGTAVDIAVLWLPMEAAAFATGHHIPPLVAYGTVLAVMVMLLAETINMLLRARAAFSATTTVHHLRTSGGIWWEAGTLVAHEDDPLSAGRLVHAALALADTHRAGLVVVPRTPTTRRAYLRRGFIPGPLSPRVLIRPPHTDA